MLRRYRTIAIFMLSTVCFSASVQAQSILRDAETEHFLHEISDPIFEAANLKPDAITMYLLSDKSLNAFVAGGQNIFIHSGLFMEADNVDQLVGVIAHETGHIAGGHLTRVGEAASVAGNTAILSMVLGAAAILAGSPDAGMGMMMAGQSVAQGQFLAYSRVQESSADQAGASYLKATGHSGIGLLQFFEKLRREEVLAHVRQDPYIRSHPLTSQRIQALKHVVSQSPYYLTPPDRDLNKEFLRLKAKLYGYLYPTAQTLKIYPPSNTSIPARYARVYAYHKALEWDLALHETDELIKAEPNNPYFYEIKGQILFESGQISNSIPVFEHAVSLAPDAPLISTALGQALVSFEDDEHMKLAIPILKEATRQDKDNTFGWYNLARAYSATGNEPMANLATAERYYSARRYSQAALHARRAMDELKFGTIDYLRAQDIYFASRNSVRGGRRGYFNYSDATSLPDDTPEVPSSTKE